jgi:hypothetical protein
MQIHSARTTRNPQLAQRAGRQDGRPPVGETPLPLTAERLMRTRNKNRKKKLKQNSLRYMMQVIPDQNAEGLNVCRQSTNRTLNTVTGKKN